ncbi:HlyD family secretion protein [Glaciecola petra]|uniref:HlyD family efflux transporter periplasmic adaptor subunit n=1 Tax=Glaciecola petra TaxID=3075602 RepID=A0ABU2ZL52_9ALTE|nr:HlyD family efflux transporter periplasmic adaptor subunit [Aestuariibacter sp. P117]MDT0593350.1 HlyD family efflux transporter periplasmic adaptor subunit [Aestuariibacter sp. P117]
MIAKTPLFRQEALDAQKDKQYGEAVLLPSFNILTITILIFLCVTIAIYFAHNYTFSNTVEIRGWIEASKPGIAIKSADNVGIIESVLVKNGDLISKGQALFTIKRASSIVTSNRDLNIKRASLKRTNELKIAQIDAQKTLMETKTKHLETQQDLINRKATLLSKQSALIASRIDRLLKQIAENQSLANKGLIAQSQIDVIHSHLHDNQTQLSQINIQLLDAQTAKSKFIQATKETRTTIIELTQQKALLLSSLQSELLAIKQSLEYTVTAPTDGFIENITLGKGDSVVNNQLMANIAANSAHIKAFAYIPSHDLNFINTDKIVNIKVDGFDYKRFGMLSAKIQHISKQVTVPQHRQSLPVIPSAPSFLSQLSIQSNYLTHGNKSWLLKPGMLFTASVTLEELSVFEWVFSSLISLQELR